MFFRRLLLVAALALAMPVPGRAQPPEPGCPASQPQRLLLPITRAALLAGQPITVVAFGSSSTEGSGASTPAHTYPAQLEALLRASLPNARIEVVNLGRGGQAMAEMLARLNTEAVARQPQLIIWQAGTNDTLKGNDPLVFHAGMLAALDRLRGAGIDVVLMDSQRSPRVLAAPSHAVYDEIMASLASEAHVTLFSRAALMRRWAGTQHGPMIGPDGLHHTDLGYACLADALGRSILAALRPGRVVAGR